MKITFAFHILALVAAEAHYKNEDGIYVLAGECRSQKSGTKAGGNADIFKNGRCKYGCITGWTGTNAKGEVSEDKGSDCKTPKCDEGHCGTHGICVGPNRCVCSQLTAQNEDGGCYSLRVRGLIGAAASLAILIVCITTCHCIQQAYERKHPQPQLKSD
ncbi:Oidioi.mRNA.OKI2018_I69.XSR.g15302.t1.cds [Oikopleura dioica]|uniref:Oidioi.mRNA.OKI2018_I69.XSR.g15302.t1.cds n=1 Tax=Oikopleura dioica TaxID=34765 RepID=A0ABN7SCE9_OIKDI|nr:Oidioi.mRNA.OKI2018_I69.XSR.g15302.t1.cds [Oikopleura dioica]